MDIRYVIIIWLNPVGYTIKPDIQWLKGLPIFAKGDAKMYSPVFPLNLLSLRPDILLALQVNQGPRLDPSAPTYYSSSR